MAIGSARGALIRRPAIVNVREQVALDVSWSASSTVIVMSNHYRRTTALLVAVALLTPAVSTAQNKPDRDTREIMSYVLTEAALAKYSQANQKLAPLMKQLPKSCDKGADADDSDNVPSLDDIAARYDAVPGVRAAIKSAGMTTREYLVFTWSVFQSGMAAWAVAQPGGKLPAGWSMANVDFYKKHEAQIQKLGKLTESADCGDDDRSEDDTEQ